MYGRVRALLWSVPVLITFSDVIGSVIKVEGVSMQPTFNPDEDGPSDWVWVEKLTVKYLHRYPRGSVMVLWAPDDPHRQIVKRLIGVEGDLVLVGGSSEMEKVPQGRCWIEGDRPNRSSDSLSAYGPVHLGLMEGRVTHILWPLSRAGRVPYTDVSPRLLLEQAA